MQRVCWYHGTCRDGFGAAYAMWKRYGCAETVYQSVQYSQPPPELSGPVDELYLLDFSYPKPMLQDLRSLVGKLFIIDHHVTAEDALRDFDCHCKIFDMQHSGAYLSFQYFWPDVGPEAIPLLFEYIEDRDLWRFELPHSHEVTSYIRSFDYDFNLWSQMEAAMELDFTSCVREGAAIERRHKQLVDTICAQVTMQALGDYSVPTVNTGVLSSEVGHRLLDQFPDAPFVASYFDRADGQRQFSLRSRKSFDCSVVARSFGGGGHATAAGFCTSVSPVE
jgi:oligoribonuclease NrnB/cAMP/cGMP phosphodiesterase (DHH superfamily)